MLASALAWIKRMQAWRTMDRLLVANTLWMLLGEGTKLMMQMAYFVIIARMLGADGYGLFIGVVALIAVLTPFSSLGRGELLVMHVSRDRQCFPEYFGNSLVMTALSGTILTGIALGMGVMLFSGTISPLLIVCIALSDLIGYRLLEISGKAYQAFEQLQRTAQLNVLIGATRLLAAVLLVFVVTDQGVESWALLYLLSTVVAASISLGLVTKELGRPAIKLRKLVTELRAGSAFSISQSSLALYSDVGKTVLLRYSTAEHAGIYAAASRIVDVALTPVYALMDAAFPRFFQEGVHGLGKSVSYASRLLLLSLVYCGLAWLGLWLAAPLIPWVLGDEYRSAVEAIQWMAIIPLLKGMHVFAADALTGAGFQGWRTGVQVLVAVVVTGLHILIVPLYAWGGAIAVSIVGDVMLCGLYWAMIGYLLKRERSGQQKGHLTNEGG